MNKFAVITGASSGIGYELSKQFAQNGYDILVAAEDGGIVEAAQAFESFGNKVDSVQVDLARQEGVERLYAKIKESGREIDSIAINAGVGVGGSTFAESDVQAQLNVVELNIASVVHLTHKILQDMIARGEGRILFTSSIASLSPGPYYSVYAASKAFVQSFAEAIRAEVKDKGIVVTALMPGATDTNFFARADMENTPAAEAKKDDPADVAKMGFDALMAGKDSVITVGLKNKIMGAVSGILPQTISAKMQGAQIKPKDQN